MTAPVTERALLEGEDIRAAFAAASAYLRECAAAIDGINVYPVPDGDTGSNMAATLAEAVDLALLLPEDATPKEVFAALAKGALYGARGNSGVILSQALRGLAEGCPAGRFFDARAFAEALSGAAVGAYRAVSKPVEGTMLTVLRVSAEAVAEANAELTDGGAGQPCFPLMRVAREAAQAAEAETINQLQALQEAGVPDAGGEGICTILRGLDAAFHGEIPEMPSIPQRPIAQMAGHAEGDFGFCTEFLIEAGEWDLEVERVREAVSAEGNTSVVVVGDEKAARVHVHTADPDGVLALAGALGVVSRVKVDDMTAQNVAFEATGSGATARIGLLALSRGAGLTEVFESLGAKVSDLGEVVKPPAGEIAAAADAMRRPDVIVLPNHKNVVAAALQAVQLARSTIHVIETESITQGIAAALAFGIHETTNTNLERMREAITLVRTVEVTVAAANRSADGVQARAVQRAGGRGDRGWAAALPVHRCGGDVGAAVSR
ncbi:MAG: DAK2 domain-containing protein, partial [Tepidiformaceae bacterium]